MKLTVGNLKLLTQLSIAEAQHVLTEQQAEKLTKIRKSFWDESDEIGRALTNFDEAAFTLGIKFSRKMPNWSM